MVNIFLKSTDLNNRKIINVNPMQLIHKNFPVKKMNNCLKKLVMQISKTECLQQ